MRNPIINNIAYMMIKINVFNEGRKLNYRFYLWGISPVSSLATLRREISNFKGT